MEKYTTHVKPIGQMTDVEFGAYFGDVSPISEALAAGMYGCVGSFEETIGTFTWSRIPADPVIVAHVVDALQGGRGMGGSTILLGGILGANALQERDSTLTFSSKSPKGLTKISAKLADDLPPNVEGKTDWFGNIRIRRGLPKEEFRIALRHEANHSALTPKGISRIADIRRGLRRVSYQNSHLVRYLEEATAQTYATRNVFKGAWFPVENGYVDIRMLGLESYLYGKGISEAIHYFKNREPQ